MTERSLQATVEEMCKLFGVAWYHTFDSRRSNKGWPDLVLCGRKLILRELKTDSGALTDRQATWGKRLREAGQDWDVWRPADLHSGRIERELRSIR